MEIRQTKGREVRGKRMSNDDNLESADEEVDWRYQIRLEISDSLAESLRDGIDLEVLQPLYDVLSTHSATSICQYDAFADFCHRAERNGEHDLPLYKWTLATINNPEKKAKYLRIFTIYVRDEEVYPRTIADALEQDLQSLVGGDVIESLSKYDSNPSNNPQVPAQYRN